MHHEADVLPPFEPPIPVENRFRRNLAPGTALEWLNAGWVDFKTRPGPSLLYGIAVFIASVIFVAIFDHLDLDYALFPALAGFMVVGPLIAGGLYEKSRRLEAGEPVSFGCMLFVRPRSGYQMIFMGVLLLCLFMLWIRAAVLIYALFFGVVAFPGMNEIAPMLFTTSTGWGLLIVGGGVGALFAAFAFAISVFAVPMLMAERTDALTASGASMAMVWGNLPVMLAWGAVVMAMFAICAVTFLAGLIVVFPVLGHATWRAWSAMRPAEI